MRRVTKILNTAKIFPPYLFIYFSGLPTTFNLKFRQILYLTFLAVVNPYNKHVQNWPELNTTGTNQLWNLQLSASVFFTCWKVEEIKLFYMLLFHSLFKVEFDIDHFVLGEHREC